MRLGTISTDSGFRAVLVGSDSAEVLGHRDAREVMERLAEGAALDSLVREGEVALEGLTFAPPVLSPEKIFCVGLNYRAHAAEAQMDVTPTPVLFSKYTRAMIGASDDILLPPESTKCDWEAELAIVIGTRARRVTGADAKAAIGGYTVLNDITMRDWQKQTSQMLPGKTFEQTTPMGPWIVAPGDVDDARDLMLRCTVNGVVMQEASTSDMIFSAVDVVSYLSSIITLVPGDVIALGTPSGIGARRTPPIFLQPGDRVVTECEGIGTLENLCVVDDSRPAKYA